MNYLFCDYQREAERTADPLRQSDDRKLNAILGLVGETGELADYLKKVHYHGIPISRDKVVEELGDVLWYLSELASSYGLLLDYIAAQNVTKLRKRYPDGFKLGGGNR